ncbi:MAG: SDR family oxidoreductase [Telluria sp.]
MALRLKHLSEQIMVIAGATGGIGLTTARMAASRGARLVLAADSAAALDQMAAELRRHGTVVLTVTADVGRQADVARVGMAAIERFGRVDTWINHAGSSMSARVSPEDKQRLFQTNFWGVVHGSLEAVRHMKTRGGGALINLGSDLSERAVQMQGMYPASKHAVKGFTDSLRMELEKEKAPISVTLVKPAAIDALYTVHARYGMEREPALPPPVYAPELVAEAILYAARHPRREVFAGGAVKLMSLGRFHLPGLLDRYMRADVRAEASGGDEGAGAGRRAACARFPA